MGLKSLRHHAHSRNYFFIKLYELAAEHMTAQCVISFVVFLCLKYSHEHLMNLIELIVIVN